jgi:glycosyltransferase involved in cell wall biosynthesis
MKLPKKDGFFNYKYVPEYLNLLMLSLIISVYNKIKALQLILSALSIQRYKNFEVLVADDGSDIKTSEFISVSSLHLPFKIKHVYHEDKGFRKNKILNEAIKKSNTNYLVFIDGDCIPHSEFIYQHFHNKQTNSVLAAEELISAKAFG